MDFITRITYEYKEHGRTRTKARVVQDYAEDDNLHMRAVLAHTRSAWDLGATTIVISREQQ